jgi:hypothetical protein
MQQQQQAAQMHVSTGRICWLRKTAFAAQTQTTAAVQQLKH